MFNYDDRYEMLDKYLQKKVKIRKINPVFKSKVE